MRKNSLGDRMKEYERTSDTKLVRRLPMIVRLDGKAALKMNQRGTKR